MFSSAHYPCNVLSDLIDDLAYKGLVISSRPEDHLTELRQRDEALRSTKWERHALLYHYLSKWHDVRIHVPEEKEEFEGLWVSLSERKKQYGQFVDVYGKPPPLPYGPTHVKDM